MNDDTNQIEDPPVNPAGPEEVRSPAKDLPSQVEGRSSTAVHSQNTSFINASGGPSKANISSSFSKTNRPTILSMMGRPQSAVKLSTPALAYKRDAVRQPSPVKKTVKASGLLGDAAWAAKSKTPYRNRPKEQLVTSVKAKRSSVGSSA